MYIKNLYSDTLIEPCLMQSRDELFIVSGYAAATFARQHIQDLIEINPDVRINLIIGMPGAKSDHLAFIDLHNTFPANFTAYYYTGRPPVHCKTYSWYKGNLPIIGFSGSANYSQFGFKNDQQVNQLSSENPSLIKNLFDELVPLSILIPFLPPVIPKGAITVKTLAGSVAPGSLIWEIPDKRVRISFLGTDGELPGTSGLNWGQRLMNVYDKSKSRVIKQVPRGPNEAYLSLKQDSRKEGFLPKLAYTFSLITDDRKAFDCVIPQADRKSIQSTKNNSLLGLYFRERLGLASGSFVYKEDLVRYGRTDYTIEKLNEETFLLDFSV